MFPFLSEENPNIQMHVILLNEMCWLLIVWSVFWCQACSECGCVMFSQTCYVP